MLKLLLDLRRKVPAWLSKLLLNIYWQSYWRRAEAEESTTPGAPVGAPISGSERAELIEAIAAAYPFERVLEVGCSYGQNFSILGPLFPNVAFIGLDADSNVVDAGRKLLLRRGIQNAFLVEGSTERLEGFAEKSFDIVISSAFLLYISPARIEAVAEELLRVCRGRLYLMEQQLEESANVQAASGVWVQRDNSSEGYWLRDYRALFKRVAPSTTVRVRRVPAPRWQLEHWQTLACLIEIETGG